MNLLYWNVRGAGGKKFSGIFRNLRAQCGFNVLAIFVPRIGRQMADRVGTSLGFSQIEFVDAIGFSSGFWLLWDDYKVKLQVMINLKDWPHMSSSLPLVGFVSILPINFFHIRDGSIL